jgi:tetratricopeptide (TPR) repeat protein
MQSAAPADGIVISEDTRYLVEGYFELRESGPTEVKGVAEPINVYEVIGAGPLHGHFDLAVRRGLSKFVGRESELKQMAHALELAHGGHGQIVAVVAEAGTGKSRLFYEFKATLPADCKVLEAYSVSHSKASAWLPVLELLHDYFCIQEADDAATRREKLRATLAALDPALSGTQPYLFTLLAIPESPDPIAQMDPQVKRRRTLEVLKRIVLRESVKQPIVIIFEDLHWIDGETQALLDLLIDSIPSARVLLMVNYRPEYRHEWVNKSHYSQLQLESLADDNAAAMLNALVGDTAELEPLRRMIIERTQGNPFFIEEMLQALFDEGLLTRNGVVKIARPFSQLQLPRTIQGILAARIDRQPGEHKQLLQTLAVIGRESRLDLIGQIVPIAEPRLHRMLAELRASEFIYEQPGYPVEFVFKHALTQQVAYNSVLIERRKQLHERIGGALESLYANSLDDHLAELAHHYARANNAANAARYLTLAGKQALGRSAFSEAQTQLQQGLEWIKALPESLGRDAQELELISALAQVLAATQGYSAPAVEMVARASALVEKRGDLAQVVLWLFWMWAGTVVTGDYRAAAELADRLLELAQREGSPTSLACAHDAQLQTRLFRGDLAEAEEHFIQLDSLLDTPGFADFGYGAVVIVVGVAGMLAFHMGRADTARQRLDKMISFSHNSQNPYDAAFGLFFESYLYWELGDPRRAEAAAIQALALAEEGGFVYPGALARSQLGLVRTQVGDVTSSVALLREALAGLSQIRTRIIITMHLTCLALAQAANGKIGDALDSIEAALSANPEEVLYRPYTLTARGEMRLKIGKPDLAEADFHDAILLAQKMGAKSYELRATMVLARLLRDTGRRDEARTMLAEIYNWFTEGFDTADLKDAKALLDELAS